MNLGYMSKAVLAAIIAGLSAVAGNHVDSSSTGIITDILAFVVALNAVYFVPNRIVTTPTK